MLSDEYKLLCKCVQIAMLYLEDDDAVNAETYIREHRYGVPFCRLARCEDEILSAPPANFSRG